MIGNSENKDAHPGEGSIILKGTGYGLRMVFPENVPEEQLLSELSSLPSEASVLAGNLGVVLDFQGRHLSRPFILRLLSDFIWTRGFKVLSWATYDTESQEDLRAAGLAIGEPVQQRSAAREKQGPGSLILVRSLRSGQKVDFDGDVTVIGHVNDGAEVFATGSICVWGRLKGIAHAGLDGSEDHTVVAGLFEAAQVRIGGKVSSSLGSDMEWWGKPVIITSEQGALVVRELKI